MLATKFENQKVQKAYSPRKTLGFQVGDRVITSNSRLGTVVRLREDEQGEYIVVKLDILAGEFAYDSWDLDKL